MEMDGNLKNVAKCFQVRAMPSILGKWLKTDYSLFLFAEIISYFLPGALRTI